ncbi:hypothetical protein GCM10010531_08990 [Blastococcus jejuensis]|uniref:Uncharacterized protein n=1 Tax=Blastococcus jejuensis TaxID=351224 RepID=A0ABP6NW99_9ACTN
MPSSRRLAAVLLALALAGCTAEARPTDDVVPTGTPGDGGALDAVADHEQLPPLESGHSVRGVVLDPDGDPVVLANQIAGDAPLHLLRRDDDGGWTDTPLTDQDSLGFSAELGVTDDGTAVVTGYADRRFSITRVTPDGQVSTVPVDADLDPDRIGTLNATVAPAGDVVYIGYTDPPAGASGLLAVDAATGAVRAQTSVLAETAGPPYPARLAVTPDGTGLLVAFNHDLDDITGSDTTSLTRYDAALQPLGEVSLVETDSAAATWALDLTADGTALIAVRIGDDDDAAGGSDSGMRLLSLAPGASTVTEVASFPERYLLDDLAVDPAGEWLYLAGLQHTPLPDDDRTITVVDLRTGAVADPLLLCPGYQLGDLLVDVDDARAVAATRCEGDGAASLWTLG